MSFIPEDILALAEPEQREPEQPARKPRRELYPGKDGTETFRFKATTGEQVMVRSFWGHNATDRRRIAERWAGENGWRIVES